MMENGFIPGFQTVTRLSQMRNATGSCIKYIFIENEDFDYTAIKYINLLNDNFLLFLVLNKIESTLQPTISIVNYEKLSLNSQLDNYFIDARPKYCY